MHMHSSLETRGTSARRIHNNTVGSDKKVVVVFSRHGPQKIWESKELKEFPKTLESYVMTSDNKTVKPQSVQPTLFK